MDFKQGDFLVGISNEDKIQVGRFYRTGGYGDGFNTIIVVARLEGWLSYRLDPENTLKLADFMPGFLDIEAQIGTGKCILGSQVVFWQPNGVKTKSRAMVGAVSNKLKLKNGGIRYDIKCCTIAKPETVQTYVTSTTYAFPFNDVARIALKDYL